MKAKYFLLILLTLNLFGCKLDTEIYDKINPSLFPKNESEVKTMVTANAYHVFSPWRIFGIACGYTISSDMVTDHCENTWGWTTLYNSYEANDWHIDGDGRRIYDYSTYLASMTLTLDRIKDVPMSDKAKDQYNAELKCGLGFLAFLMYDLYGPIPVADLETLKNPIAEKIIPRLSEEDMRTFIESNLLAAKNVLPYKYESTEYGRFTKGLAVTLLLKYYMLIGEWSKAEKVGRELTDPMYGYELVKDYNALFTLSGEVNTETIFAATAKKGENETQWHAHVLTGDYPTPSGMTITKWGGYKIAWPFYETFEKGDKRLDKIAADYVGTEGVRHNRALDRDGGTVGVLYKGAVPVKYGFEGTVGEKCEIDMPIYRYADVVTLLSEAIVRNGNKVTQEAVNFLNMVRTRAGLTAYTLSELSNVDIFLDKLLMERGHEFYLEGVRRQDLIRHGKFIETAIKKAEFAGESTAKIAVMADGKYKYEKFPLPTHLITEGQGVIKQNPGY